MGSHSSGSQLSIVRAQEDIGDHRACALISPPAPPGWTAGHTLLPGHVGSRDPMHLSAQSPNSRFPEVH